jgi:hypothetical protein
LHINTTGEECLESLSYAQFHSKKRFPPTPGARQNWEKFCQGRREIATG